jgi:hypothetical protein
MLPGRPPWSAATSPRHKPVAARSTGPFRAFVNCCLPEGGERGLNGFLLAGQKLAASVGAGQAGAGMRPTVRRPDRATSSRYATQSRRGIL